MRSIIIIPARLASTRLPEKVIIPIYGKPLVQHVYERALKVKGIHKVVIAVDDQKVFDICQSFGAETIMTSANHISGTDRIIEASKKYHDYDFYINLQGDEPLIEPTLIDSFNQFTIQSSFDITSLYHPISHENDLFDYNVVKVVKTIFNQALYFSRSPIPAMRDTSYSKWFKPGLYLRHIGIYGFTKISLNKIETLKASELEKQESLEQLRWLENGLSIGLMESPFPTIGIDVQEDVERVEKLMAR